MKKILLILCGLLCVTQSFGGVFANTGEDQCLISDAPAEAITNYVKDLGKTINNISRLVAAENIDSSSFSKVKSQSLRITNATTSFGSYFSSFDYYIAHPITSDIPPQIERDHKLLLSQNQRLINAIKRTLKRGGGSVIIEDACSGVISGKCSNLNGQSAESILAGLLKNHKNIMYFYEKSVTGGSNDFKGEFIFVDDNFEVEIGKNYGPDAITTCSNSEDEFGGRISESIENIGKIGENSQGAMNKWKYSWAVLTGNEATAESFLQRSGTGSRTDYYKESGALGESDVLKRYLGETGVGAKTSEIALENLERYNQNADKNKPLNLNNKILNTSNPLENTARKTFGDIENQIDTFNEAVIQRYKESSSETIPINLLQSDRNNIDITQRVEKEIRTLYADQERLIVVQDTTVQNLIAKMIKMHVNLSNAINTLDEATRINEEVCDAQGKGMGRCNY